MIRFDLVCENQHTFDSWFASGEAFEKQLSEGYVACPHCGSQQIKKQLMMPSIPARANKKSGGSDCQATDHAMLGDDKVVAQLQENIRQMRKKVMENAEDVGDKFAEEARKIHYEEKPARGIYGKASPDEAKSLLEEGVDVMPLPELPEDKN